MDSFVLELVGYFVGMVAVIVVVLLAISKIIAKKNNQPAPKLEKKARNKMIVAFVISILCILLALFGIVATAYGLSDHSGATDVVGECYNCDGAGVVLKNGLPVTCPSCNGFGSSVIVEYDSEAYAGIGIIALLVGVVGYFVSFVKIRKFRNEAEYAPQEPKEISPYAVQVKLYDTGYDTGSRAAFKMIYTFTDADTGVGLGRGTQFEILTLNVDKPTRIKCHLGRGFKDVILNYIPRENAKYRVIPNIHTGIRFEETTSF